MKLQRQLALKKGDKRYYKWVVTLPAEAVEQLGWKVGTELSVETKPNGLIVRASR